MANPTITSLAILTVNSEEENRGYLDYFVSFLAECIRRKGSDEVISVNELQTNVLAEFGLRLPLNTIKGLLPSLEKQGYIQRGPEINPPDEDKQQTYYYTPNWNKLQELEFQKVQQDALRQHEELIESFISFCEKRYNKPLSVEENKPLSVEEAEDGLLSFFKDSGLHTISIARAAVVPFPQDQPQKSVRYLVAMFIQHLQDTQSSILPYLDTVARGYMLANAVFLPDVKKRPPKFQYTQVYFDAGFLMFALGYAGEAYREACKELLELLREQKALLRCFRHTLEEVDGILNAFEQIHRYGQLDVMYGPSAEYFQTQQYRASDIERFRQRLENDLKKLEIFVVEKPPYVMAEALYQVDEEQLESQLRQSISYKKPVALERDVASISAIMRLRKGVSTRQIENCKALFVTTNADLARIAREFCRREYEPRDIIPPSLTDHVVTTLVWLKKPIERPQLPMKRIIADCYAATQPDDRLWAKYMAEIQRLEQMQSEEITQEDYFLLKYSTVARSALMEITLGDENVLVTGTIPEIVNIVHLRIQEQTLAELEEEKKRHQETKSAEDARQERVRQRAQKVAHILATIIRWGLWIVLAAAALYIAPWGIPFLSQTSNIRVILAVIVGLLGMFAFLNLMFNTPLDAIINRFEEYLGKKIEQWLHNLTQ